MTRHFLRILITPLAGAYLPFLGLGVVFTALSREVKQHHSFAADSQFLNFLHRHATPAWDSFFGLITNAGDVVIVSAFTVALVGGFYYRKQYYRAFFLGAAMIGTNVLNIMLKAVFERRRPQLWQQIVHETSFSFPSGHAMASSALAFSLIYLAWSTRWRWLVLGSGLMYTGLIGLSRLYLGVHFPTDIIGGWIISLGWILLLAGAVRLARYRKRRSASASAASHQ